MKHAAALETYTFKTTLKTFKTTFKVHLSTVKRHAGMEVCGWMLVPVDPGPPANQKPGRLADATLRSAVLE